MPVSMETLTLGEEYTRPYLAALWGFASHQAISRGIVTPRLSGTIILFVTKEKQNSLPQYQDYFEGEILHMEGETNHANDERLINAERVGDLIFLFYRERHHQPFTYYGQVKLINYEQNVEAPSSFSFTTARSEALATSSLLTEELTHGLMDRDFEPDIEGRRKIQRHLSYERSRRNRAKAIEIHGTRCHVCGFDFNQFYGVELARHYIEIHHVKLLAQHGEEIVNPATDLIPLCSNCHSMVHRKRGEILSVDVLKQLVDLNKK